MADNKKKKTNNTEAEIEAALAAATGSPLAPPTPPKRASKKPEEPWFSKENLGKAETKPEPTDEQSSRIGDAAAMLKLEEAEENENSTEGSTQIAMSQEDFGRKCFNLDINAKMCNYQSNKSKDTSIDEFLRGINKKIYDETRSGGYSTNIQFRVAPNDYVNVNHILDWYKSRGFQILNYNMGTAPYGANAGLIEYSFTISWVEA